VKHWLHIGQRLTVAVPLEEIPYVDYPELQINEHERTEMPFRYVKDAEEKPIMPDVSPTLAL
jgi:ribosome biogenesis SPOUT family RNA methylase Rps3